MRITPEHYAFVEEECSAVMRMRPEMLDEYRAKGWSDMRYRWDLAHLAGLTGWFSGYLYPYLNDHHIDTALRKITGTK